MAEATLYEPHGLSRFRLWPPRRKAQSALVLEGPASKDEYRLVTRDNPIDPITFIGGRYRRLFRVNMAPVPVEPPIYELPSSEFARPFIVDLKLTVQADDAVKVVEEQQTNAWEALEPVLSLSLREIGRRHAPERLAEVEKALHDFLTDRPFPQVGLRVVRAGVKVNLEGPDVKRAREKIEDRHRRELDEQNTRFRVRLEKEEAQHLRVLERLQAKHRQELGDEREKHHIALESERRKLYEEVVGKGLLPKLLLIKLGARPAGGDHKDLDEVIDIVTQLRVDNFKVPLELLAQYTEVMERWQLEEPVTTLLKHLVDTFGPQAFASQQDDHVIGDETEVKRVDPDPEGSDDEDKNR
jgi:hypothetical protein